MRRREFITFVGSALVVSPIVAHAQQNRKVPHIGYLMDRSGPPGMLDNGFFDGLREHGYVVGQNVEIEYRWTDGKTERLSALARELVDSKVDIIIVAGADSTKAAKAATTTIPIVMASSQDAVGDGLVASLAHPGGLRSGTNIEAYRNPQGNVPNSGQGRSSLEQGKCRGWGSVARSRNNGTRAWRFHRISPCTNS
jgi:putative ABC transport system substrate-binding protein